MPHALKRAALIAALIMPTVDYAAEKNCLAIDALPYTITAAGNYCLTKDIDVQLTRGNALTIASDNVSVDFQNHRIRNVKPEAEADTRGVYAFQKNNILISGGGVSGFAYGIWLNDNAPYERSHDNTVAQMKIEGSGSLALWVIGARNTVKENRIEATGGVDRTGDIYGILIRGAGAQIVDNVVAETKEPAGRASRAIALQSAPDATIGNNKINNNAAGAGLSFAIHVVDSRNVAVKGNTMAQMTHGIFFDKISSGSYANNNTNQILVRALTCLQCTQSMP